jgi:hypothetical protein
MRTVPYRSICLAPGRCCRGPWWSEAGDEGPQRPTEGSREPEKPPPFGSGFSALGPGGCQVIMSRRRSPCRGLRPRPPGRWLRRRCRPRPGSSRPSTRRTTGESGHGGGGSGSSGDNVRSQPPKCQRGQWGGSGKCHPDDLHIIPQSPPSEPRGLQGALRWVSQVGRDGSLGGCSVPGAWSTTIG